MLRLTIVGDCPTQTISLVLAECQLPEEPGLELVSLPMDYAQAMEFMRKYIRALAELTLDRVRRQLPTPGLEAIHELLAHDPPVPE